MSRDDPSLPLEQFIQAITTQLDHAQSAMAIKAANLKLPLTFAVKDIALDLRTHVEFAHSEVRIRPAGPGDQEASTLRLSFTTITRPMIEENATLPVIDPEDEPLEDAIGDELTAEEQKRLEWAGVRTVGQLRDLQARGVDRSVGRVANLPVDRLRRALERAAQPLLHDVLRQAPGPGAPPDLPALVRIRGRNLVRGEPPRVTIGGEPVSVVRASRDEVVVAPRAHQMSGELVLEPDSESRVAMAFDLRGWPELALGEGQSEPPAGNGHAEPEP